MDKNVKAVKIYKFCPRCASQLTSSKQPLICPNCGLHLYINPKSCVGTVLLNSDGKLLLGKRGIEPLKGWWDIPGGFIEEDETLEEGAKREVREELNIKLGELKYLKSYPDKYLYQGIEYETIVSFFAANIPPGSDIKAADDVSYFDFFDMHDLPFEKIAFSSSRHILRELMQK